MKPHKPSSPRSRGSAAVELALLLPVFVVLLNAVVFFGLVFWHYTVAAKAAHDAALFLANTSPRELQANSGGAEAPVVAVARQIVQQEIQEMSPGVGVGVTVYCQVGDANPFWENCFGFEKPKKVMVRLSVSMSSPFFDALLAEFTGSEPIILHANMTTDYVGG